MTDGMLWGCEYMSMFVFSILLLMYIRCEIYPMCVVSLSVWFSGEDNQPQ